MRLRWVLVFFFLMVCVFASQAIKAEVHEEIYARVRVDSHEERTRLLSETGLKIDAVGRDWVFVVLDSKQMEYLVGKGYKVNVLLSNMPATDAQGSSLSGPLATHKYTLYDEMVEVMLETASDHPNILILDTLGYSVEGRLILGAKISDNPTTEENEPEFAMIAGHHGTELAGSEMALLMMEYLTDNYGSDPQVTHLVDGLEIWIVPRVNPDGNVALTRYNANGMDINRDYGYMWNYNTSDIFSQPETRAIREHGMKNNFSVAISFHNSADVIIYPWFFKPLVPADNAFMLSVFNEYYSYADYQVLQGYDYKVLYGVLDDWGYGSRSTIQVTVETGEIGFSKTWNMNLPGILAAMERTDDGVRGVITDAVTGEPVEGMVRCTELGLPVYTDPVLGDYQKNLLPGTYTLKFSANGYQDSIVSDIVVNEGGPAIRNVALEPGSDYYAVHVISCWYYDPYDPYVLPSEQYMNNPTDAPFALGLPDGIFASFGKGGHVELDMGENTPIIDLEGDDFTVHETDYPDGYHVYWSDVPFGGTWNYIGTGYGTTSFDISALSTESIRYLKIADDDDGDPYEMYPGCDIDAVTHPKAGAPALTAGGSSPTFLPGDATGDRKVDLSDAIYLLNYLYKGGPQPVSLRAGDANLSGSVELGDAIHLLNYLYRGGPPPSR
jgi:hypothetical protein